jgi:hypothetical protein
MGKLSSAFEKTDTSAAHPYRAMNFIPTLGIHFRIANSRTRWRCNFSHRMGGRTDFSENLRASLSNDNLSKELPFISLDSTFEICLG